MSRLILFPRRNGKTKAGDASAEDVKAAKGTDGKVVKSTASAFPIENVKKVEEMKSSEAEGTENAYKTLREGRSETRFVGVREKRAKTKAEEAANAKK